MPLTNAFYFEVDIDSAQVDADITDFVGLIDLKELPTSHEFWNEVDADGGDIRVALDDETIIPFELENFNVSNKTGVIHYRNTGTTSTTSNTTLKVFYETGESALAADATNGSENVWIDWNFVSHDGGATDSSGNHASSTASGGVSANDVTGQIADATNFDGTDDSYDTSVDASGQGDLDLSVWVNLDDLSGSNFQYIIDQSDGTTGFALRFNETDDDIDFFVYRGGGVKLESTGTALSTGTNYKVDARRSKSSSSNVFKIDINGASEFSDTAANDSNIDTSTANTYIGSTVESDNFFNGWIDEVRIRFSIRSDDYLTTEYNNQSDPATFQTLSAQIDNGAGGAVSLELVAETTVNSKREDGSTRTYKFELEQKLTSAPGSVQDFPLIGEVIIIDGSQSQNVEKEYCVKQAQMTLSGDPAVNTVLSDLVDAARFEFFLKIEDTTSGYIYFNGWFEPQQATLNLYKSRQTLQILFTDALAYLAEVEQDVTQTKTLSEISDEIITTIDYTLINKFVTSFRPATFAASDIIPDRLRVPYGFSDTKNIAGYNAEGKPLSVLNALQGTARLFGGRYSIANGFLYFTELYDFVSNPTARNEYDKTGGTYSYSTPDLQITVTDAQTVENKAPSLSTKIPGRQFIHQLRILERSSIDDITEAEGGQVTQSNKLETFTTGGTVITGDDVREIDGIDYEVVIDVDPTFDGVLNVLRIRVKNQLGPDLYYDFNQLEWSETASAYQGTFSSLSSGQQTFTDSTPAIQTPDLPESVIGELVVELLLDVDQINNNEGSEADIVSLEITNMDVFVQLFTTSLEEEFYNRFTGDSGATTGRTLAQTVGVGSSGGINAALVEYLDGSWQEVGDFEADTDADDRLEVILTRRLAGVLNGKRTKFTFRVRDLDPIGMHNSFLVTDDEGTPVPCIPVWIRHELFAGYYDIKAVDSSLDDPTETEEFATVKLTSNDGTTSQINNNEL